MFIKKLGYIFIILLLIFIVTCNKKIEDVDIIKTILSTDLSLNRDPDDWFDTYIFLSLPKLNPAGIILENYATDTILKRVNLLKKIMDMEHIPVVKGVQKELSIVDGKIIASKYNEGAKFIIKEMKEAKGKIRLISVGSLRNEALAYKMDSILFLKKIEKIYFAGGRLGESQDINVRRDILATQIVINSEIPIVWIPCTNQHKQKLTGKQENRIAEMNNSVSDFLMEMLKAWRNYKSNDFLKKTKQLPNQGKNLWSIPAFLKACGYGNDWIEFERGKIYFDVDKGFRVNKDLTGKDLILKSRKQEPICEWLIKKIDSFNQ